MQEAPEGRCFWGLFLYAECTEEFRKDTCSATHIFPAAQTRMAHATAFPNRIPQVEEDTSPTFRLYWMQTRRFRRGKSGDLDRCV